MKKLRYLLLNTTLLATLFQLAVTASANAQLTTTRKGNYGSITYLVNKVLLGNSGITASNITYQGIDTSFGFFNGVTSNVGMDTGLVITNGTITLANGPGCKTNDDKDGACTTYGYPTDGWPKSTSYTDTDLATLVNVAVNKTLDCAVLQFDFVAVSDSVEFQYVFGSNEEPCFAGKYADDFGFFLSGPGIAGPYTKGAINLAVLPGTTTAVSINTINCATNSGYYVCNSPAASGNCSVTTTCSNCPKDNAATTVGYGGFTTVLTAKAKVQCGKTYHIKLGVADISTDEFDSGVFLKGGSFKATANTLSVSSSSTSTCPGKAVTLTAANATNYTWSPAATLSASTGNPVTATPNVTTTYTVLGNSGGCGDSTTIAVIVDTLTPPVVSFKDSVCSGNSTTLTVAATGFTYSWNTGATTSSINVSPASTTTYTLTATNKCGQDTIMPVIVHVVAPVVPTITATYDTLCLGSSATLTASGGSGYTWSTGATTSSITVTPTADSVFVVTTTNGCPGSAKDTIRVIPPVIVITISGPSTMCPGGNVTLVASGASTYVWSPSSSLNTTAGTTVIASPTVTTTYTVAAKIGSCNATAPHVVMVDTVTPPNITFKDSICAGGSTTITATGSYNTYSWSTGSTNSSITVTNLTTNTNYTLTVTDTCGQSKLIPITVHIVQPAIPIIAASADSVCPGSSATLIASGGSGYTWAPASTLNTTTGSTVTATPTVITIYTVTTTNMCPATAVDTVGLYPPLTPSISGPGSVCAGGSVQLTASGGTTYTWSPATGLNTTTGNMVTATPTTTTTYTVYAQTGTCSGSTMQIVTINPAAKLIPSSSVNPVCPNTNAVLSVTGGTTYTWSPATALSATTGANVTATPASTITYTINSTSAAGCKADTTLVENVIQVVQPIITGNNQVCQNDSITLTATGGNGTGYKWSNGSTTSTITFSAAASGNITVWNIGGCSDTSNPFPITVITPASVVTNFADTTIALGSSVTIGASGVVSYQWNPIGTVSCFTCPNTSVTPATATTYTVTGTDANGCKSEATVIVLIECKDFTVPNVFTPNGDGINDDFTIKAYSVTDYDIEIFDRWGISMYKSTSAMAPWDGRTASGEEVPDGVYYYIIKSKCGNSEYDHHGFVQVIR